MIGVGFSWAHGVPLEGVLLLLRSEFREVYKRRCQEESSRLPSTKEKRETEKVTTPRNVVCRCPRPRSLKSVSQTKAIHQILLFG